jgi:hypothetical protein
VLRDAGPWLIVSLVCCIWPGVWAVLAFLIGRGYRVRVEKS